jgi:hypothetical protein
MSLQAEHHRRAGTVVATVVSFGGLKVMPSNKDDQSRLERGDIGFVVRTQFKGPGAPT